MAQIRAGLVARGLMVDSDELRHALLQRSGTRNLSAFHEMIGFLAVVIGAPAIGAGEVHNGLLGVVAGGSILSVLGFLTTLTALLTDGWRLSTRSPAGAELFEASRAEYANTSPNTLTRDEELRRTAVHGMR